MPEKPVRNLEVKTAETESLDHGFNQSDFAERHKQKIWEAEYAEKKSDFFEKHGEDLKKYFTEYQNGEYAVKDPEPIKDGLKELLNIPADIKIGISGDGDSAIYEDPNTGEKLLLGKINLNNGEVRFIFWYELKKLFIAKREINPRNLPKLLELLKSENIDLKNQKIIFAGGVNGKKVLVTSLDYSIKGVEFDSHREGSHFYVNENGKTRELKIERFDMRRDGGTTRIQTEEGVFFLPIIGGKYEGKVTLNKKEMTKY